jgi:hypothetical protein
MGPATRYRLHNLVGLTVGEGVLSSTLTTLDTATLPAGVYVLSVEGLTKPVRMLIHH